MAALALETRFDVHGILTTALNEGVLILDAGRNVPRFLPPLCIDTDQIEHVIGTLDSVLGREEPARLSSPVAKGNA